VAFLYPVIWFGLGAASAAIENRKEVMNLAQIAENWNGQVTKLFNWSINRLQTTADKSNVKATRTDYRLPSVKERRQAGKLHRTERGKRVSNLLK
jgi:hypothetical protein